MAQEPTSASGATILKVSSSLTSLTSPIVPSPPSRNFQMRLLLLPIPEIKIPEDRQRRGLGGEDEKKSQLSFEDLKASLRDRGMINPPRVDLSNTLVAGFRRVKAWESLGNSHIHVTVDDGEWSEIDRELMELDENIQRLDLTWQEKQRTIARIDELRRKTDPHWNQ